MEVSLGHTGPISLDEQAEYNTQEVLASLVDLGEAMVACGADVGLVEHYLGLIGKSYGAERMNVLVITTSVVVTMTCNGEEHTITRRIISNNQTDFYKLQKLHNLARQCGRVPMDPKELKHQVDQINKLTISKPYLYLGGVLATGSFAVFFGGTFLDGLVAALFSLVICYMQEHWKQYCPNVIVFNFLASLVSGLGIMACCILFPQLHMNKIIMGAIMLLIPGIAMTNSVRDMISGDTVSGLLRFSESLLWAGALAIGYMVAIILKGMIG